MQSCKNCDVQILLKEIYSFNIVTKLNVETSKSEMSAFAILNAVSKYWKTHRNTQRPRVVLGITYWLSVLTATTLIASTTYIGSEQLSGSFISCVNSNSQEEAHCKTSTHWYHPVPVGHPKFDKPQLSLFKWIPLIFLVQAILLLCVKSLWPFLEGGLIKNSTLAARELPISQVTHEKRIDIAGDINTYMKESNVLRTYGTKYLITIIVFWFFIAGNLYFMSHVVDADLQDNNPFNIPAIMGYLNTVYQNRSDFLINAFPVKIGCKFELYGPSGMLQNKDILCSVPQNSKTEYIYMIVYWGLTLCGILSVVDFFLIITAINISQFSAGRYGSRCQMLQNFGFNHKLAYFILKKNVDEQMWFSILDDLEKM